MNLDALAEDEVSFGKMGRVLTRTGPMEEHDTVRTKQVLLLKTHSDPHKILQADGVFKYEEFNSTIFEKVEILVFEEDDGVS